VIQFGNLVDVDGVERLQLLTQRRQSAKCRSFSSAEPLFNELNWQF
jgi:hypothetical protein